MSRGVGNMFCLAGWFGQGLGGIERGRGRMLFGGGR